MITTYYCCVGSGAASVEWGIVYHTPVAPLKVSCFLPENLTMPMEGVGVDFYNKAWPMICETSREEKPFSVVKHAAYGNPNLEVTDIVKFVTPGDDLMPFWRNKVGYDYRRSIQENQEDNDKSPLPTYYYRFTEQLGDFLFTTSRPRYKD
ncbi:hypothetical protein MKW98_010899 [Papaver atlanticum]|uniref:Uncharacterized protein n=1 Tax=Papaver atlanticum TaxID=357466 RepID=A0AAD4SKK5_9MAGN|nr:hypothetical protein MKW98_010899 [Papaver atlanticum]